jgi:acyl-CoA thioesterase
VSFRSPSLAEVIATLRVDQADDDDFVATQLDNPGHHIVGGHIAGQALMAASRTAPGRTPHSVHVYYLRAGDARHPVDFHVARSRDGGTLSTRQVTARQDGLDHQTPIADVPQPESLPPVQEQLAAYADELHGHWVRPQPFELRYVDPPPGLAVELPEASPRIRMWWRPSEPVPNDEVLHSCLLT